MAELNMHRGDTLSFDLAVTDGVGAPVNLAGASLRFTAKRSTSQADSAALIALTIGDGITVTDAAGGLAHVEATPAKTSGLEAATLSLTWDEQLTTGTQVFTVASGYLTVMPDVSLTVP
jgi:hypothetical protein